ncbi:hypothetical protein HDU87_007075 [Geranomyces variabilis]|uniref:N-acetyltransferase domain-containing protein n=1 Tax=Geranomyces variabilis TaxID=109894 RepID=A0AAD5XNJ7_9FUNG|nr:hypothetical protein HDU87_007075 [Geranomyces variabilis]
MRSEVQETQAKSAVTTARQPADPRPTGLPVTPLSIDSPSYSFAYLQSSCWDEGLSMNVAHPERIIVGPHFVLIRDARRDRLLSPASQSPATDESFAGDIRAFLEQRGDERNRIADINLDVGVGPFADLSPAVLSALDFEAVGTPGHFAVWRFAKESQTPAPTLPVGFEIHNTVPGDAYFHQRVALESKLFPISESYAARLPGALAHMVTIGSDQHWVVVEKAADRVVSYNTMRYGRGIAYLQNGGTEEAYRRKGFVRALMHVAEKDARERGYDGMGTTGCDDRAWATWAAIGFTEKVRKPQSWTWKPKSD